MDEKPIHHVELTPKRYKLLQMIGGTVIVLGFLGWLLAYNRYVIAMTADSRIPPNAAGMYAAAVVVALGFLVYSTGRFLAWWNHG